MTKKLIALFTLTFLVASQAVAFACQEICDQQAKNSSTKTSKVAQNESGHDCHGNKKESKEEPAKAPMGAGCPMMTICAPSVSPVTVAVSQVEEKDSIKKIMIRGEAVVPDFKIEQQVPILAYLNKPLPQKIRLHLRLRRLLN